MRSGVGAKPRPLRIQSCAAGARESTLVRGGGKLGVRRCGPSRRLVPHARLHITGHAGQRQARGRPR